MRCTPVGTWQTNRGVWRGPGKDKEKVSAEEGRQDEDRYDHAERKGERGKGGKTYANSYDVGFIFEALWRKRRFNSEGKRLASHSCPDVRVPDTVIYRSGYPAQWYFQSKQEKGKLLRKKPSSVQIPKIFEIFGAWNGIVACFVGTTGKGPTKTINNIVFFDRPRLKDFLFGENMMREGFLQRFVAPESIPFDSSATNVTLHVSWSKYACVCEERVNKAKLDNKQYKTAEKVNLSATRVDSMTISKHTRLHKTLNTLCTTIADHVHATSFDNTEITNMTAYFKIGENNTVYLLFVSSVTVAKKNQDAYGFITSLLTFTGRHSPELMCPDFFGLVDHQLKEAADHEMQGRCALCTTSNEDDPNARSYAVTYKMLAEYSAAERIRILEDLRFVCVPELDPAQVKEMLDSSTKREEVVNLHAKASALFALLDVSGAGQLPRIELWAGLLDYGYNAEEIALILGIAGPSRAIKDLEEFAELSGDDELVQEEDEDFRPFTPDFDVDEGASVHASEGNVEKADMNFQDSHVARECLTPVRSRAGDCAGQLHGILNSRHSPQGRSVGDGGGKRVGQGKRLSVLIPDSHQESFESKQSTHTNVTLPEAKDLPASFRKEKITLEEFVVGVKAAIEYMPMDRLSRFNRNVDMLGHAEQERSVKMEPQSPKDAFGGMLDDSKDPDEVPDADSRVRVEVNVDFAKDAVDRSRARQLARKLPASLMNLRNVLPPLHVKRIIAMEPMPEDFSNTRIWCCKKCATKFNAVAAEVFSWSDKRKQRSHNAVVNKKLDNLRQLKTESFSMAHHNYPVGELPALCTPRMYRALHDHTSRSYTVGPPQATPGGIKDLLAESGRIRQKNDFRKPRLPQLDKLPVDRPDTETKYNPDMADLMDRLGLTPRRPVKGHFGSQYKPKQGKRPPGADNTRTKEFSKPAAVRSGGEKILCQNSFDWLEGSLSEELQLPGSATRLNATI